MTHVEMRCRAGLERTDILGPLAGKDMPMPGAMSQAMSASRGGILHIDARNFAGPHSLLGPVAGKVAFLPGAQSQAMAPSLGGGLHIDARNFVEPRSVLGPVAGKEAVLPGAQSQAMVASRGGSFHVDGRKFAAPRYKQKATAEMISSTTPDLRMCVRNGTSLSRASTRTFSIESVSD